MRFSVIVPIYKTEQYLRQCLDSIVHQTCSDFELILVDDGSPDHCGAICDEYAAAHDNIRVVHKENGGLVSARKAGIALATGEYVINIDSDDWVEPDYFRKASEILDDCNPDIIAFAVRYCYENREEIKPEPVNSGFYDRQGVLDTIVPQMLLTPSMTHMHYYVWAKVYRRSLVTPCQLAVDERISMGEDVSVSMPGYLQAQSVFVSEECVYDCRCHNASMSRKFNPAHYRDIELGVALLKSHLGEAPAVFAEEVERYCAFMCFVLLCSAAEAGARDRLTTVKQLWCDTFIGGFQRAQFGKITRKSKIALFLLKKKKIGTAYRFLRLCALIKGDVRA